MSNQLLWQTPRVEIATEFNWVHPILCRIDEVLKTIVNPVHANDIQIYFFGIFKAFIIW